MLRTVYDLGPDIDGMPTSQAGLRLETDFYASTKAELEHFYSALSPGGVLILDDYGCFQGSRQAADEHLHKQAKKPLLNRIDHGIWAGVKPGYCRGDLAA